MALIHLCSQSFHLKEKRGKNPSYGSKTTRPQSSLKVIYMFIASQRGCADVSYWGHTLKKCPSDVITSQHEVRLLIIKIIQFERIPDGLKSPYNSGRCHRVWGMSRLSVFLRMSLHHSVYLLKMCVYVSRHTLPVTAPAVCRPSRAASWEVQKDAVMLRLGVQRLQDVVHHDLRTGRRAGAGARVLSQNSGGRRGVRHQRTRAVCVLVWGGLWEDGGGGVS